MLKLKKDLKGFKEQLNIALKIYNDLDLEKEVEKIQLLLND